MMNNLLTWYNPIAARVGALKISRMSLDTAATRFVSISIDNGGVFRRSGWIPVTVWFVIATTTVTAGSIGSRNKGICCVRRASVLNWVKLTTMVTDRGISGKSRESNMVVKHWNVTAVKLSCFERLGVGARRVRQRCCTPTGTEDG